MSQAHKRVRWTRKQIKELLERFDASDDTQGVFAEHHNLSVSTLRFWIARRRRESTASAPGSRFVPVSMTPSIGGGATGLELEFGDDRRLHIPPDIDADALARLLPIIVGTC